MPEQQREDSSIEATIAAPMLKSKIEGIEACGCPEASNSSVGDGLV